MSRRSRVSLPSVGTRSQPETEKMSESAGGGLMAGSRYQVPSTQPKVSWCRECRQKVRVALWDALPLCMDPQALSLTGELHAHLQGLKTWWLVGEHLYRRHSSAIRESPHGY